MKSISLPNRIADQKPGKALTVASKWRVLRVFQRCLNEQDNFERPRTRDFYQKTSEYTGVFRCVVVEIVKHFKQTGTIPPVAKPGNRTNHSLIDPATTLGRIREFINESHLPGLTCTSKHWSEMLDSEFKITVHLRAINVIFMI